MIKYVIYQRKNSLLCEVVAKEGKKCLKYSCNIKRLIKDSINNCAIVNIIDRNVVLKWDEAEVILIDYESICNNELLKDLKNYIEYFKSTKKNKPFNSYKNHFSKIIKGIIASILSGTVISATNLLSDKSIDKKKSLNNSCYKQISDLEVLDENDVSEIFYSENSDTTYKPEETANNTAATSQTTMSPVDEPNNDIDIDMNLEIVNDSTIPKISEMSEDTTQKNQMPIATMASTNVTIVQPSVNEGDNTNNSTLSNTEILKTYNTVDEPLESTIPEENLPLNDESNLDKNIETFIQVEEDVASAIVSFEDCSDSQSAEITRKKYYDFFRMC